MRENDKDNIIEISFPVKSGDFVAAGDASSKTKQLLKQIGIDPAIIRRASIACYEAEINLVIHSMGGTLVLLITPVEIIIRTEDIGPGIADIDLAMKEGYTTASDSSRELGFGAGMGLPNMQRCADNVEIVSKLGSGTVLTITIKTGA
ncbi:MAG TPA: ATP-binding protein [Bacillota bacterium]|nr:ATP-binding protein [Bacillota bacterium]